MLRGHEEEILVLAVPFEDRVSLGRLFSVLISLGRARGVVLHFEVYPGRAEAIVLPTFRCVSSAIARLFGL